MDTREFLDFVLPSAGLKVLARPRTFTLPDGSQVNGHLFDAFPSVEAMAEAALQFSSKGETVFFAVQGYNDWYEEMNPRTGKMKRRIKTQKNVRAIRSLYDDFDVSTDPTKNVYRSREEALQGVKALASALRLAPTVTSSGGGFHFYITLDQDISPELWGELSAMKRRIVRHLALTTDPAVDMDSARVLRPVGTSNHKYAPARPVELMRQGKVYSVEHVLGVLQDYIDAHNVADFQIAAKVSHADNPFAMAVGDYPPSSAEVIATHCSALRSVAEAEGNVSEPLWRAMLGLVKHCTEGDALCHEWSRGHPNYDEAETQAKLDNWHYGPTLCDQFDALCQCKAECPHSERVRSPIRLGYTEDAPSATESAPPPEEPLPGIEVDGEHLPLWPHGYRWNGSTIARSYNNDGVVEWVPFSRALLYPVSRTRLEDGTWAMQFRARKLNGHWTSFLIPTADVAAPDTLARSLGQYEVFLTESKRAKTAMTSYVQDYILSLQQANIGSITIPRLGWLDDPEGFAVGDNLITGENSTSVLCGKEILPQFRDLSPSGTVDAWVEITDKIVNRPNAEPIQFAFCHAFGAPLTRLMDDDQWHGIPVGFTGPSGSGKTTIAALACSIFARAEALSPQGTKDGMTLNAAIKMMSQLNGLPYLFDEMSGRDPVEVTALVYAAGNGKAKIRVNQSGGWATTPDSWFTGGFLTSNDPIYSILAQARNVDVGTATQLRVFEVELPDGYITSVLGDMTRTDITQHLATNYGAVGREYLKFIITNREWVKAQLQSARAVFNPRSTEETKERFYLDALATAVVAGKIAAKLGFLKFPMKPMIAWAKDNILSLRDSRARTKIDPDDILASFISSLHGRMIVTHEVRDSRSTAPEQPIESIRGEPVGRVAITSKKVFVQTKALNAWCRDNDVKLTEIRKRMDEMGLLVVQSNGGAGHTFRIGTGTTVMSSPAYCYELNYNVLLGNGSALRLATHSEEKENVGT